MQIVGQAELLALFIRNDYGEVLVVEHLPRQLFKVEVDFGCLQGPNHLAMKLIKDATSNDGVVSIALIQLHVPPSQSSPLLS